MNLRSTIKRTFVTVLAVSMFSPASVLAAGEDRNAIEIGQTGVELYQAGEYQIAVERFRTAERVSHSPVFGLYEARCLDKLGRLLEAKRVYEKVAVAELPAEAPPAWRAAVNDAARELAILTDRIPSVELQLSGAEAVALKLDGTRLDLALVHGELLLDPGPHEFEASSKSGLTATARIELREGERKRRIALALPVDNAPPKSAVEQRQTQVAPAPAPPARPATDALGVGLLIGAGAGFVAGAVTGFMASQKLSEVKRHCVGLQCPASHQADGEAVESLALASTLSFVLGGAALTAWGLRVILTPSAEERAAFAPVSLEVSGRF